MTDATSGQGKVHGGDGKFVSTPESAERDAQAARLRGRGWSYDRIGKEMGYADGSGAYRAVQRALRATQQEAADEVRHIELGRLDALWETAAEIFGKDSPLVQQGRVVLTPTLLDPDAAPQPVVDEELKLKALDRLLRIQERRARLLGLDAPQRHSIDAAQLGDEIRELLGLASSGGDDDDHD